MEAVLLRGYYTSVVGVYVWSTLLIFSISQQILNNRKLCARICYDASRMFSVTPQGTKGVGTDRRKDAQTW